MSRRTTFSEALSPGLRGGSEVVMMVMVMKEVVMMVKEVVMMVMDVVKSVKWI